MQRTSGWVKTLAFVLYRGNPPWDDEPGADSAPDWPPVIGPVTADIVVVGAGITGALLAYRLSQFGREVLVVDSRPPATGSTFASTAMLSYQMDVGLADMIDRVGEADAVRVYELGRAAIGELRHICADLGDVGYRNRHLLYLARTPDDEADLRREHEALRRHGFAVDIVGRDTLRKEFRVDRPAGTLMREAAEVDPVRLTRSALAEAGRFGAEMRQDRVTGLACGPGGVRLTTAAGGEIHARRAVFATGYETKAFLDVPGARLTSTFVAATDPLPALPAAFAQALVCEAGAPYFYLRTMPDNRILIGGEDEEGSDSETLRQCLPAKVAVLSATLAALFPDLRFTIGSAWAAVFSATDDGLPYVGAHPDYPGALFALGYGGNGITFAATAASILADLLSGRGSDDARIFRFDRPSARK